MIEAQSRYINGLVGEVIQARQQGKTLSLQPSLRVMQEYNDKIQALLRTSSFADPNCNSWYKREDGLVTNNWSGTVLEYQKGLSEVQWQDYIAEGSDKDRMLGKKPTQLGRVREETFFSDRSLLIGSASAVAMAGAYYLARSRLLKSR